MAYLLSLLTSESSSAEESILEEEVNSLCYYINKTKSIQNIKMIAEQKFVFEKLVFPGERMLFEAPFSAYITINSFLLDGIKTTTADCQHLRIAEKYKAENAQRC
jgi:hypothetical protein